jgi:hypothetical protein
MVTEHRRRLRRPATNDHILQLFDTPDSLGNVVSAFLNEGWEAGEHLLVVAKPRHWSRIADRLNRRGCSEADAIEQGRLTVLDVQPALAAILRGQVIDPHQFRSTIGALVGRLTHKSTRAGLRVYGEIVEVLAEEGNFEGARQLETLWNELREQHDFALLCGYSAAHFAGLGTAPALQAICDCHTRVQRNASDLLGSWLLNHERADAAETN